MRIVLHDYPGHAFPIQLSRELARREHQVLHLHFGEFQSPKGPLAPRPDDPPSLEIRALGMSGKYQKYSLLSRRRLEKGYGRRLAAEALAFKPDVVLGGNGPLDPQAILQKAAQKAGVRFIFWLQDIYGVGIDAILRRRLPVIGGLIGAHYRRMERRLWRKADGVVAITEDFRPILESSWVPGRSTVVIENWASLDDLSPGPKDNAWAQEHGLADKRVFLYSGTMGLKHSPEPLLALARHYRPQADVRVVVVSEGIGADKLAAAKAKEGLGNLVLLPFQPYERLPEVIATGDVLVVVLEADASLISVPSKVLTYFCAGRPVLASMPTENLAARLIRRERAGAVSEPEDQAGFLVAADRLIESEELRAAAGRSARAYAEISFDIERIADRFELILSGNLRQEGYGMADAELSVGGTIE